MKKGRPLRYAEWTQELRAGGAPPAVLFCGPETLLRDAALRALREALGPRVDHDRFVAGESPLGEVASALATVALFADRRLVSLSDLERAGRVAQAEREALLARLRDGIDATFVAESALPWRELERKAEWIAKLGQIAEVVEFLHPRPDEAMRWLLDESTRLGVKLTADAGALLVETIGPDLQELMQKLQKLSLGFEPGVAIGVPDLKDWLRSSHRGSVWALCDAVVAGRGGEALRQWDALRTEEAVLRVVWLLQQKGREGAARNSGMTAQRLQGFVLRTYDLERGIKTGRIPSSADELSLTAVLAGAVQRR